MKLEQVSIQPYTIRNFFTDDASIQASLKRIADIGYKAVEAGHGMAVPYERYREICDSLGLTISSVIENHDDILHNPQAILDRVGILGTRIICYVYPTDIDMGSELSVKGMIEGLDRSGAILREAGYTLTYHNHALEFRKLGGKCILERIFDETAPDNLAGHIDTFWVQAGGGDPERWVRRLKGRLPALHIKDFGVYSGNQGTFMEIGAGNLDFPSIIRAAEESGCKWFVVEQDMTPGDPFASLEQSYDYIVKHLVE